LTSGGVPLFPRPPKRSFPRGDLPDQVHVYIFRYSRIAFRPRYETPADPQRIKPEAVCISRTKSPIPSRGSLGGRGITRSTLRLGKILSWESVTKPRLRPGNVSLAKSSPVISQSDPDQILCFTSPYPEPYRVRACGSWISPSVHLSRRPFLAPFFKTQKGQVSWVSSTLVKRSSGTSVGQRDNHQAQVLRLISWCRRLAVFAADPGLILWPSSYF
jgi:hypothetical protein